MQLKVRLKFNEEERLAVYAFVNALNAQVTDPSQIIDVDSFCKKAVFYAINDAYKRAERMEASGSIENSERTDEHPLQDTASSALSNEETTAST